MGRPSLIELDADDQRRQADRRVDRRRRGRRAWKARSRLDRRPRACDHARVQDIPIIPVSRLDLRFEPAAVAVRDRAPRRDRRAFCEAAERKAGTVERPRAAAAARRDRGRRVLSGAYLETDFASFIAWRDWGFPDRRCAIAFAMAALRSSDGAFLLGVMGAHTANAGQDLFPRRHARSGRRRRRHGRSRARRDARGGRGDRARRSPMSRSRPAGTATPLGQRIALMKIVQARETAAALRERIRASRKRAAARACRHSRRARRRTISIRACRPSWRHS